MKKQMQKKTWSRKLALHLKARTPLSPTEWSNTHVVLPMRSSAEPGRYRTSRTPYIEEPLNRISADDPSEMIVWMKSAQCGATQAMLNQVGWVCTESPGPIMMVYPTIDSAQKVSKFKLNPMIADTPVLCEAFGDPASKTGENSLLNKSFPGGMLILAGANSTTGLRTSSVQYLLIDEVDEFPAESGDQGSPITILMARTTAYETRKKIVMVSTPTTKGDSHIEEWYDKGDQRKYHVPCPHCGNMDHLKWSNVIFDKDNLEDTHMVCEVCNKRIDEHYKTQMLANGEWIATTTTQVKGLVSYHINSLYSPAGWYTWPKMASDFLDAKKIGKMGLKAWINTRLAETFEDKSQTVDQTKLFARRHPQPGEVPEQCYFITAGVDTQDEYLAVSIVGWAKNEQAYIIDHIECYGDPDDASVWGELDDILNKTYKDAKGNSYRIVSTFVDSGGHKTTSVYDYCRTRSNVHPVIGRAGDSRQIVVKSVNKNRQLSEELLIVGVDQVKSLIYARLALADTDAFGYIWFPLKHNIDENYFKSLCAEKRVARKFKGRTKYEWIKIRERNEALDCFVYALSAMVYRNPDWDAFDKYEESANSDTYKHKRKKPRHRVNKNW